MKPQIQHIKQNEISLFFLFIIVFFIISCNSNRHVIMDARYKKMNILCDSFVFHYEPTKILGKDTLVAPYLTNPPDSLNNFLLKCAENKDFRFLKYAVVIFLKQSSYYYTHQHQDYEIFAVTIGKNGFVELMRIAMGVQDKRFEPYFFSNVLIWEKNNKRKINDFKYVKRYLKEYRKNKVKE